MFSWGFPVTQAINLTENGDQCGEVGAEQLSSKSAVLAALWRVTQLEQGLGWLFCPRLEGAALPGNLGPGSILCFSCPS